MMKKILFFDSVAPYEYNYAIIKQKGLGASESYLLSVANEIKKNFDVDISTAKVRYNYEQNDIVFKQLSLKELGNNYHTIIIQRDPTNLKVLKNKYPKANFIIWLHDFYESSVWATISNEDLQYICDNATLLCVSEWHKFNFQINLDLRKINNYRVEFIHFFISPPTKRIVEKKVDVNKLCFFSAGHKGLEFTLRVFEHLSTINPNFKLYIGNPTYDQVYDFENSKGKIVNLRNQTRDNVLTHLQNSLCAFHLNKDYPETFGCVNAEANLVNTPVMCYDIGATKEILYKPYSQLIEPDPHRVDLNNLTYITETIFSWMNGNRPEVKLNPKFDKKIIIEKWVELIENF